ncbi:DUF1764-domain-containing protein [Moesziomyces antarcticus]|uniref:DUF1764-domain-containing protein n=1 Tax=Pseudozyma antarctica TaxID=84753 RepID=A0A081CC78_PSEA2|nr:DUF1764-domain-containing protein [Moesziomyces antarcticus]GAK64274.1 DUF1764-domain-containing protein [Moesziomyces antarcticus]
MGKSKTTVAAGGNAAVASEIDDIFSSSTTSKSSSSKPSKATRSEASSSRASKTSDKAASKSTSSSASNSNSKSKRKREADSAPSKKRAVEVVTDTSSSIPTSIAAPPPPKTRPSKSSASNGAFDAAKQAELEEFANSRGGGERKTTDDGLRIFSAAELGMNDDGGDTELCPFDCNCSYNVRLVQSILAAPAHHAQLQPEWPRVDAAAKPCTQDPPPASGNGELHRSCCASPG